jgi:Protein of unknown function (DUF3035)
MAPDLFRTSRPNPHSSGPRLKRLAVLAGCCLALGGCEGFTRTIGLVRDAPDEFTVTTRAPLAMPPEFSLPPPQPGAVRPQERPERVQAEEALVPQMALGGAPAAADSPGQEALVRAAGPPPPPRIRQEVNAEVGLDQPRRTLTDRLLFWQDRPPPGTVVDPTKESRRLRENAALGHSPETGDTPIVQPQRKSLLGSIDPF